MSVIRTHLRHLNPRATILRERERFEQRVKQLRQTVGQRLRDIERDFLMQVEKLETLSPLKILARGFSVTLGPDGKILRDTTSVSTGDEVKTRLYRGSFRSRVERIEE